MELTAIENNMSVGEKESGITITITCKHCKESQTYTMRSKTIPNRPKTQCQNEKCEKWIYIDKSLLVKKNDQKNGDQRPNDQSKNNLKTHNLPNKPDEKPKSSEITQLSSLTKTDQMTKPEKNKAVISSGPKLNSRQNTELTNYFNGLATEVQLLGRTIPLDVKQRIVNTVFENLKNLTKGIKYYLNAWESRYKRYLKEKPGNPLIDEYEDMKETLNILKKLKETKQEFKCAKIK